MPSSSTSLFTQIVVDGDVMDYELPPERAWKKKRVEEPPKRSFSVIHDIPRPLPRSVPITTPLGQQMAQPVETCPPSLVGCWFFFLSLSDIQRNFSSNYGRTSK